MHKEIRNLNDLKRGNNRGIYKHWIYRSVSDYQLVCDYLQKINYSIQDINRELSNENFGMKEVVFIISLVDWIKDSYERILCKIKELILKDFSFSKEERIKEARKYFVAIRSFVVAHPMNTTMHKKFGLDGDFICVDIRKKDDSLMMLMKKEWCFNLDFCGIHRGVSKSHEHLLYSYSTSIDNSKYFKYISFSIKDIVKVAELYIDALYELDRHCLKQKKRCYMEASNEQITRID